MILEFQSWINKYTEHQSIYHKNELTDSVTIDFENDFYIARFTVWDDSSCMSEILGVRTGQYILNERYEFSSIDILKSIFMFFNSKLIDNMDL